MTLLTRLNKALDKLEEWLIAALLAVMTLLTFIQVVLRYGFNSGLIWSLEATTYSFAWMVLIGMSYGVRTRSHIVVDILSRALPPAGRRVVALAAVLICLTYAGLMLYGAYSLVDQLATMGHNARDIAAPRWLLSIVMPIGFSLLGLRLLQAGWRIISGTQDHLGASQEEVPTSATKGS